MSVLEKVVRVYQQRCRKTLVLAWRKLPIPLRRLLNQVLDFFYAGVPYFIGKTRGDARFAFQGDTYEYFYRSRGRTWRNERAVEIPVIMRIVERNRDKRILEVGNVLSNYFHVDHDILDKYEEREGVINDDVVTFEADEKYDLIVSISTLEHVGWDELKWQGSWSSGKSPTDTGDEPMKVLKALENLRRLLNENGTIVATWGLGYNTELDTLLDEGRLPGVECLCLKRTSKSNQWVESDWDNVKGLGYTAHPFAHADGLVVAYFSK
jgi:SAM-dependent methyltransferase